VLLTGSPPDEHAFAVVPGRVLRWGVLNAAAIVTPFLQSAGPIKNFVACLLTDAAQLSS
jgi:hypothetical protein